MTMSDERSEYQSITIKNSVDDTCKRLIVGTPTRGLVRMEWVLARYGQIIPCNWSMTQVLQYVNAASPIGYTVADAQNVIVDLAVKNDFEWLLLIEDDTMPPPDAFIRLEQYIKDAEVPIVSGLYYTKSMPPEPMVYRGRGNSYYDDWKLGDLVWADGVPTGFLLVNVKVLKVMWDESPEYQVNNAFPRKVFEHPQEIWFDPETKAVTARTGTSDLNWCDRIVRDDVLRRAGWPKIGRKKYPFLIDTNLFCHHIDQNGTTYPPLGMLPNYRKAPKKSRRPSE